MRIIWNTQMKYAGTMSSQMLNSRDGYTQPSYQTCLSQVSGVITSTTEESGSGSGRDYSRAPRHTLVNRNAGSLPQENKREWHEPTRVFVLPYDQLLCYKFLTSSCNRYHIEICCNYELSLQHKRK